MTEPKIEQITPAHIEEVADKSAFDMFRLDQASLAPIHQFPTRSETDQYLTKATAELINAIETDYDLPMGVRKHLIAQALELDSSSDKNIAAELRTDNSQLSYDPQSNRIFKIDSNIEGSISKISMDNFDFHGGSVIPLRPVNDAGISFKFTDVTSTLKSFLNPLKDSAEQILNRLIGKNEPAHPVIKSKIDPVSLVCGMAAEAFQSTNHESYRSIYGREVDFERIDSLLVGIRELGLSLYDQGRFNKNELTATRTITDSIKRLLDSGPVAFEIHEQRIIDAATVLVAAQR